MLIREAVMADVPAMLDIYNEIILNTTAVYSYSPHTLEMRQQWLKEKQEQGWPVLVADMGGAVAGYCTLGPFRAWPGYKYTAENSIYVATGFRGQGVGKILMPALIDAARAMELHTIIAGIDADNDGSVRFHEAFGFKEVAHLKEVGYKFDRWLDVKFLQLML